MAQDSNILSTELSSSTDLKKNDFDIAIVGMGPSGCACALALHNKGLRVVIIDKEVYPRDKICGDAIPSPAFKAIESINKVWGSQMKLFSSKTDITTSTFYTPNNKPISYKWKSYSYNSKRIDFDNFLFQLVKQETDTTILEKQKLQNVTTKPNYSTCTFQDGSSIKVSIVIGCDGANSIVKKSLVKVKDPDSVAAIRAYYKGIKGIKKGENEFHIVKGLPGYFWIFPLQDDLANVGFGVFKKMNRKSKTSNDVRHTLKEITHSSAFAERFNNSTLVDNVNGFGLPIWSNKTIVSGNRFLLCGDAASLIDPLLGHGIDTAIWSGILAADQIVMCFKENNFTADFMQHYDRVLHNKYGRDFSRSYFIMRVMLKFPFMINYIFKIKPSQSLINWIIRTMKL